MKIRRLDPILADRIAAGEVVERPAAAVKELVENALDAGASRIDVTIAGGGQKLIRVIDDGAGMDEADLVLCVERHATSKIPDGDLTNIATLGFRGEALPSIASVARLEIATRRREAPNGLRLRVDFGATSPPAPVSLAQGTKVEARDLFAATPARLKFLKSERAEASAVADVVKRLAMANPQVRFSLGGEGLAGFDHQACPPGNDGLLARLTQVLGRDFRDNALAVDAERGEFRLWGFAGLPTWHRANALAQFVFVNGRPVRDRQIAGAIRAAYMDYLSSDRHPTLALFITCPPRLVDVNVHPAKAEVRFADPGLVRGLVVGALKQNSCRGAASRDPEQCGGCGEVRVEQPLIRLAAARRATFSRKGRRIRVPFRVQGRTIRTKLGLALFACRAFVSRFARLCGGAARRRRARPCGSAAGQRSFGAAWSRAGADSRDLYHRPDPRWAGAGRPARRP